jgi:hypothetical protein
MEKIKSVDSHGKGFCLFPKNIPMFGDDTLVGYYNKVLDFDEYNPQKNTKIAFV